MLKYTCLINLKIEKNNISINNNTFINMEHQIAGFDDDNEFRINNGILYKKEKRNSSNRYKCKLVENLPYDERLLQEACGLDEINDKLIINSQCTKIDNVVKKSLNYKDDKYFDASIPCIKCKKYKKKSSLSEKQIKKKKIKENKKDKNVLKHKQHKYKNNNLMYYYTDPNYWLSVEFDIGIDDSCYHGYQDIGFPFVEYRVEDDFYFGHCRYNDDNERHHKDYYDDYSFSDYSYYGRGYTNSDSDSDYAMYDPDHGWY